MTTRLSRLALLFSLLAPMGQALAASTVPIVEKRVVFDDKSVRTPEQMRGYILHAAQTFRPELSARVESDNPGALQLEFNKENKYYLTVLFTYDHAGFKTDYVSSKNLNYAERGDTRIIHENTMIWMDELVRKAKAYHAMQLTAKGEITTPEAVAELHLLSTGAPDNVSFRKSDETHACGKYDEVARVANWSDAEIAAREQEIRDWNAKAATLSAAERRSEPKPLLPRTVVFRVPAQRPVQVQIASSGFINEELNGSGTLSLSQPRRLRRTCGPLTFRFTPQGAKKYAVEYAVSYAESFRGTCTQTVYDVTDPGQRVVVPTLIADSTQATDVCPR